jgi:hypothetical protein
VGRGEADRAPHHADHRVERDAREAGLAAWPGLAGDAAAYARPGDSADLADRLAELLRDPAAAAALRERAREHARSLPSASEAVRQVMTWYDAVATRPGGSVASAGR